MDIRTQCASAVMMIRPAAFDYNPQTAATNLMQSGGVQAIPDAAALAIAEFDAAVAALRGAGVRVCVVPDEPVPPKPDAVFPNNWVSWHADGTVVLYPLQARNRRLERRPEILESVAQRCGYRIRRVLDLSPFEEQGQYLEGTGSLVLDHVGRQAFACRSRRTAVPLVRRWAEEFGYRPVVFDALDATGASFYHTNVMLSIGHRAAVVAAKCIVPADRERVLAALAGSREIIAIDSEAVAAFAGNMLEVLSTTGRAIYAVSARAAKILPPAAQAKLEASTEQLLPISIPTIERLGGGSVRCMLAEVFSPA